MRNGHHIIDAHCHIYPDKIADKAAQAISDFYGGLHHIGGDVATLLSLMDQQGIDYAVVNSAAMTPHQVESVNRFLWESAQRHADRFAPVGSIHPDCTAAEQDAAVGYLTQRGFHGVKLHPDMLRIPLDDPRMFSIYARCQEAGLPVLLHTGDIRYDYSNPNRLEPVLKAFPALTVVGGHFAGRGVFREAADNLSRYPNLHADCSSSFNVMTTEEILYCIRAYGSKRLMFGTDYPVMRPNEDLDCLFRLSLPEQALEDILWRSATAIYALTPPWTT